MPLFIVERQFAEQLDVTPAVAQAVNEVNLAEGVRWLYSFLTADNRKTYCLYEAPDAQALIDAARKAGLPADVVVELGSRIDPSGVLVDVV
jgi:hypothetical protein